MSSLLTVVGLLVIGAILVDAFLTILSTSTAGPLTRAWSHPLWQLLLRIHRRRRIHVALGLTGPAMVVLTILIWYGGLVLGTWLIFTAHPGSVINNSTSLAADTSQTFYFVPTTLSGLGLGDYVPDGFPWTVLATTMTLVGTMVLTISLSYVISVISAAITRRTMASSVRALGGTPVDIAGNAELSDPRHSMHTYLGSVASSVSDVAEKQRAYPVLRYFHNSRQQTSAARAVLLLADATYLLESGPHETRPAPGLSHVLHSAIDAFANAKVTPTDISPADEDTIDWLANCARELGTPTTDGSRFRVGLSTYLQTRAVLVAACEDDGWPQPHV